MAVLLGSSIALVLVLTGCGGDPVEVPPLPSGRQIATSTSTAPSTTRFTEPSAIEAPAGLPDPPSADSNGYVEADIYRTDFDGSSRYQFKSPTGALSCEINVPDDETDESNLMTACDVLGRDGAGPGEQCNDSNATGAVLYTSYTGLYCGPTQSGSSYTVLGYANKIKVGPFECVSEKSGISCNYSGLPSFKVVREGVIRSPQHVDPSPFRHLVNDTYFYPFRSPTGALSCVISAPAPWNEYREYQPPSASCEVLGRAGSDANYACDWDDATGALLFATGAQFTCHKTAETADANAIVLEYGQTLAVEGFECTSERTGVTCHAGAPGFKAAREEVSLY